MEKNNADILVFEGSVLFRPSVLKSLPQKYCEDKFCAEIFAAYNSSSVIKTSIRPFTFNAGSCETEKQFIIYALDEFSKIKSKLNKEIYTFALDYICEKLSEFYARAILAVHGGNMNVEEIKLPGWHNVENYMAAIAAAWGDVSPENMRKVAREFGGVEHRMEFVRELGGVKYYNDSIASSPSRTISGTLSCYDKNLILICGGYDKHIPYDPLGPAICQRVKALILMGDTGPKIRRAVENCGEYRPGKPEIHEARDMAQAVELARRAAEPGDVVSLSPASASFDLYPGFEVRGRHFKEIVEEFGAYLGHAMANLAVVADPSVIVIGGGVS